MSAVDEHGRDGWVLPAWAPRWFTERQWSLEDSFRYALDGAFTIEDSGSPRRWGHVLWLLVVLIPVWSIADMAKWATERPGRGLPLGLIAMAVGTALEQWPSAAPLVPDVATFQWWYATVTGWWAA